MTKKLFDRLNGRRHDLINKKFTEGLTKKEEAVFDRLQNSRLLDYYLDQIGAGLDFRKLIILRTKVKRMHKEMFPKGDRYPKLKKEN